MPCILGLFLGIVRVTTGKTAVNLDAKRPRQESRLSSIHPKGIVLWTQTVTKGAMYVIHYGVLLNSRKVHRIHYYLLSLTSMEPYGDIGQRRCLP
ncbi:hypothetical protein F5Y00DRAFT_235813 [Daldinia vernicosa]|uniref:uncharacterized protein n=1 Tax=Daldinia vernicosa TaxID=114800 RepID=UPI002007FAC6|nr:uncharacterized protein F5Y00DRAFT_235813 [Daldinia vernicosa]KAI0849499.1 hypothetical protein F5Y00DRAFT_235813 [Daldinia vernicosa]